VSRLVFAAAVSFGLLLGGAARPAVAAGHDPILFVHGYLGNGSSWNWMGARFQADGFAASRLFAPSYNWHQSNATTAEQVAARVDQILAATGAAKVDIVSASMGGLSSRHYLKYLGGADKVDAWVSLGGPNHGTLTALACWDPSCLEMRPGSPFLRRLNSGDETPGTTRYGTAWSWCDEIIIPHTSVALRGAANYNPGCIGHLSMLSSRTIYEAVRAFVDG